MFLFEITLFLVKLLTDLCKFIFFNTVITNTIHNQYDYNYALN